LRKGEDVNALDKGPWWFIVMHYGRKAFEILGPTYDDTDLTFAVAEAQRQDPQLWCQTVAVAERTREGISKYWTSKGYQEAKGLIGPKAMFLK
jgi:hypothetical protein